MNVISKALAVKERVEDKFIDFCVPLAVKATKLLSYSGEPKHKVLKSRWAKILFMSPVIVSMVSLTVYATENTADTAINEIITLLQKWIPRLGGMVAVVGAIQLGLGFKDEDSNGKTRGMQTMIGGGIVAALASIIKF
jgi:hypothetical protein